MKKLIIFDLDGTLLDTIEDLANSVNHALSVYHFPIHPIEAYRFFVGNGVNKLLERALPEDKKHPDFVSMLIPAGVLPNASKKPPPRLHPYLLGGACGEKE